MLVQEPSSKTLWYMCGVNLASFCSIRAQCSVLINCLFLEQCKKSLLVDDSVDRLIKYCKPGLPLLRCYQLSPAVAGRGALFECWQRVDKVTIPLGWQSKHHKHYLDRDLERPTISWKAHGPTLAHARWAALPHTQTTHHHRHAPCCLLG